MKKFSFYLIFSIHLCSISGYANSSEDAPPVLHMLLFADLTDGKIAPAAQININRAKNYFEQLDRNGFFKVKATIIAQPDLSYLDMSLHFKQLFCKPNDIIFFHYSGHGVNSTTDQWPRFLINDPYREASLGQIHGILKQKNPRLLICLADCCNTYSGRGNLPSTTLIASKSILPSKNACLDNLFLEAHGSIIASGSKPGHPSYYETQMGGYFTSAFFYALFEANQQGGMVGDWKQILEKTNLNTQHLTAEVERKQYPQYNLQVHKELTPQGALSLPSAFEAFHHEIKANETLYQISNKYQVSIEEIKKWNRLKDNQIVTGNKLIIHLPKKE